jgi:glycosyltransferase involved in cell wall biosynthesis
VLAVSGQGPHAPSFRVRVMQLAGELSKEGIELAPVPEFSARQAELLATGSLLERAFTTASARLSLRRRVAQVADASVCLVQRHAAMWPTVGPELEAIGSRRFVLDVDDAIWIDGPGANGHPLALLKRGARRTRFLACRADHTIAATPYLAEWLSAAGGRVTVVPSLVDPRAVAARVHSDQREFVVGWIGSRTTAKYLERLAQPLEDLARRMPDREVRLLAVGGSPPPMRGVTIVERGWSEATEREALAQMDVGVMPLPDTPWTRGKAAYKAILYMSAGVPVVADDVGPVRDVVRDGDVGVVVRSQAEWALALDALSDARERAALGARAREHVTRSFSVERWAPVVASILRGDA